MALFSQTSIPVNDNPKYNQISINDEIELIANIRHESFYKTLQKQSNLFLLNHVFIS